MSVEIPRRFLCGDMAWTVRLVTPNTIRRHSQSGPDAPWGLAVPSTCTIYLDKTLPRDRLEQSWLHELGHVIRWANGQTAHSEREVDAHATLLRQALITSRGVHDDD